MAGVSANCRGRCQRQLPWQVSAPSMSTTVVPEAKGSLVNLQPKLCRLYGSCIAECMWVLPPSLRLSYLIIQVLIVKGSVCSGHRFMVPQIVMEALPSLNSTRIICCAQSESAASILAHQAAADLGCKVPLAYDFHAHALSHAPPHPNPRGRDAPRSGTSPGTS